MNRRLIVTNILAAVLSAGAAQAADLPARMPVKAPVVAAPAFTWTGFYIGAHAGYGWGKNEWSDAADPLNDFSVPGADAHYDISGGLAGGQIGFNWQVNQFVLGIEADGAWANIKGDGSIFTGGVGSCLLSNDPCTSKIDSLGTITGRVGVAFDRALFYAKGGAAWAHTKHTVGYTDPAFPADNYHAEVDETRWGWTVGAGLEYAFLPNWSAKIEYNYIDLGDDRVTFTYTPAQTFGTSGADDLTLHVVKAGINYRFWGN
ncbi:porin family protein [Rhodoplanes sp. TEM]|uniref:Porin family protein n=1 Tax=Rhodoplanes tepidamans TaxID=200616 RepID=A0ABT5JH08_RHOTP|nr:MULTISPECIES: outer membrane protein [Rhodoplanes]MDC7788862.1 porin family protein [Rhodoplanes tepidamans]MDC7986707.1 porin family protein [Rhodoplanes sp. TEM]MDQ0357839.1 outer membrane immunogenic protein [Rhodoplanes tepidamans]